MKTTVIYHSADYDGIFCREIAKKFLGEEGVEYIGWNFGDPLIPFPKDGTVYVLDLSPDCLAAQVPDPPNTDNKSRMVWIDHHKTSIEKWSTDIPGYRIDGVSACRLAWRWFSNQQAITQRPCPGCGAMAHPAKVPCEQGKPCQHCGGIHWGSAFCPYTEDDQKSSALPIKQDFIDRKVTEPLAVRLAGEYDIWDKRDPNAETFQYGLRSRDTANGAGLAWDLLLRIPGRSEHFKAQDYVEDLLKDGALCQGYAGKIDASICKSLTWLMEWEGLKFLCVNHARFNSLLFAARDVPETGHDALLGFRFDGKQWMVSLYHAAHRKDIDLSEIAKKHGGGGHRGACGFTCKTLPFNLTA